MKTLLLHTLITMMLLGSFYVSFTSHSILILGVLFMMALYGFYLLFTSIEAFVDFFAFNHQHND